MSEKAIAVGLHVFCKRDESVSERNGLIIPDQAKKKPNTGMILSVGKNVKDKGIQEGRKAIWNTHVGHECEVNGDVFTVLIEDEILGVL